MSGPRSSRKKRRRSIASSASVPNHSVLPAPSLNVEKRARAGPLVLDDPHRHRRRADAGHRADVVVLVAGGQADLARLDHLAGAVAVCRAQPSNRHGRDERAALRIGEPVRLDRRAGVDERAALGQHRQDVARGGDRRPPAASTASIRSTTVSLASRDRRPVHAPDALERADGLGVAGRRRAPVDVDDRRVLVADRVAERQQPDVDDLHLLAAPPDQASRTSSDSISI